MEAIANSKPQSLEEAFGLLLNIFLSLLLFSFVLPSGSLFGFPVKPILLVASLVCAFIQFFAFTKDKKFDICLKGLVVVSCIVAMWGIGSLSSGQADGFISFMKSYFSLISVVFVTYLCFSNNLYSGITASRVLVVGMWVAVAFKLIFEIVMLAGVIDIFQQKTFYQQVFGTECMRVAIPLGPFTVFRNFTSNDAVVVAVYALYMFNSKKSIIPKIVCSLLVAIFIFISYSRVLMIEFVVLVLICCVYTAYLKKDQLKQFLQSKKGKLTAIALAVIAIVAIILVLVALVPSLSHRFVGRVQEISDTIRAEQIEKLSNGVAESPIFGHGTGSYISDYVRSKASPHSYEAEYLSFIYEFGILGFLLTIVPTIIIFYLMVMRNLKDKKLKWMLLALFALWVVRPLVNPYFLSSASGMCIVAMMTFALVGRQIDDTEHAVAADCDR